MDAVARYRNVVATLDRLQQDQEVRWYLSTSQSAINNAVRIMRGHLDAIIQGRHVTASEEAKNAVLRGALLLLDSIMTVKLTPKVEQYARLWVELATNWNMQVGLDESLKIILNAIQTLLGIPTSLSELVDALRLIASRVRLMVETESSGVKLAGEFMRTLNEMIEDEKKLEIAEGKKG